MDAVAVEKSRNHPSRSSLELEIEVERETAKMFELSYFSPFSSYRGNMNICVDGLCGSLKFDDQLEYYRHCDHGTDVLVNLTTISIYEVYMGIRQHLSVTERESKARRLVSAARSFNTCSHHQQLPKIYSTPVIQKSRPLTF